jgi:hypothetical protein
MTRAEDGRTARYRVQMPGCCHSEAGLWLEGSDFGILMSICWQGQTVVSTRGNQDGRSDPVRCCVMSCLKYSNSVQCRFKIYLTISCANDVWIIDQMRFTWSRKWSDVSAVCVLRAPAPVPCVFWEPQRQCRVCSESPSVSAVCVLRAPAPVPEAVCRKRREKQS